MDVQLYCEATTAHMLMMDRGFVERAEMCQDVLSNMNKMRILSTKRECRKRMTSATSGQFDVSRQWLEIL